VRRAAAWLLLAAYAALAVAAVALLVFQGASTDAIGAVGFAGFAGVGALIALRQPRNAVGWLLLAIAIAFAGVETGQAYIVDPSNPGRVAVAWLASVLGYVWFTLALIFLPLVFPHGRLPSRRWRPVVWLGVTDLVLSVVSGALLPGPLELVDRTTIENPFGVEGGVPEFLSSVDIFVGAVAVILAVASVVSRFRQSRGTERQQLKWFAYVGILAAACLSVAVLAGSVFAGPLDAYSALTTAAWLSGLALVAFGLPAATGIAILRHRLYDVDLVIRRTLVYGALTATLGATYLALVLLAGLAVGKSNVAIAVSTLAVAGLARPALKRIQAVVDRRFYRRRYDATRTLEAFGARLRDELDLQALADDLRGVVGETVQPAHVSLWLRDER
jgi:peptidoglycan/LPS O-acetylase OafA/YrhL